MNDLNISCGHFKHNLYWDIIKGKCILVTTLLLPNHRVSIQVDLSFMSVTSSVRYCFFMMVLVLSYSNCLYLEIGSQALVLWICSQISDTVNQSLTTEVIRQISSKILICGDKVYHRKFRFKLEKPLIEFEEIQKRLNEIFEIQWSLKTFWRRRMKVR